MYGQIWEDTLFMMLYAAVAMLSLIASCYLLFRQGNAFARDVTPPLRLRRWTSAFFASMTLSHLWYMPMLFATSNDVARQCLYIGGLLDFTIVFPLAFVIMFTILQDHRRPLWPAVVVTIPPIIGVLWCLISHSDALVPVIYTYFLLLVIGLTVYMVHALRQYGSWLRDNYADLEHKEVWQSFVVLSSILLLLGFYVFGVGGAAYEYVVQICDVGLICYLLWRVETLSDLSISQLQDLPKEAEDDLLTIQTDTTEDEDNTLSLSVRSNIGPLLKQYCEDSHLYLQYDITLSRLAKEIGINRLYLSQYFSSQGMNYNAYINDLRINHFISLYREAVAAHRPIIAQQLALESGYQSYSTFSSAFKRKTGQSVTAWMASQKRED